MTGIATDEGHTAREGPNGTESESTMNLGRKSPQMPGQPGHKPRFWGDPPEPLLCEEDRPAKSGDERSGTGALMEEVVHRDNLRRALARVKANQGSPGVDGMTVDQLSDHLREYWPRLREDLLAGRYQPQPVRRCEIPKASGGTRTLGIPTSLDRFIQQAILQVLQPRFDPTFSEHSYGFRPGRSAHDAVQAAQRYVQEGRVVVVDVDLEKFFDRVNHDVLMGRLAKRIEDKRLLGLLRRYLEAGTMADGVVTERDEGTPQGGPLSPLLANVLLDEVDRELERRGHAFVRYADDCNVYVRSLKAGERVMNFLREKFASLHLRLNESKSAVARPGDRKFLGYSFWVAPDRNIRCRVAPQSLEVMKNRVREITARNGGRSMRAVIGELRAYLPGWKQYFRLAATPKIFRELDSWIRHRLRQVQLKQWMRGKTTYRALRRLGATDDLARRVAAKTRHWWSTSATLLHAVLNNRYFEQRGVPRLGTP